jgi:hypothetical protein
VNTVKDLPTMRQKILEEVKEAALSGNIKAITHWSKAAVECETLIAETIEFENRVKIFAGSLWSNRENILINKINRVDKPIIIENQKKISPKKEGAMVRERWVKMMLSKNIMLKGHNKRYHTKGGISVGIAFANELDSSQLVNKWFLGLKDEPTDVVVLLCRDKEGNLNDLIIPIGTLGYTWKALSRSKDAVKFHIVRRRDEFLLEIPGGEPLNISKYLRNYKILN